MIIECPQEENEVFECVRIDEFIFHLRPERFGDYHRALEFIEQNAMGSEQISSMVAFQYMFILRIEKWEGFQLPDGEEAPCNLKNKLWVFGKRPRLLAQLINQLMEQEDRKLKNLEISPDGQEAAQTM